MSNILFYLKTKDFLSVRDSIPKTISYKVRKRNPSQTELELHSEEDVDNLANILTEAGHSFSALAVSTPVS